jgi:hypothetical protein
VQVQADAVASLLLELAVSGGDSSLMNTVRRSVCTAVLDMIEALLKGQTAAGMMGLVLLTSRMFAASSLSMLLYRAVIHCIVEEPLRCGYNIYTAC